MKRELMHPEIEIEDHDDGLLLRFRVPGSTFGSVEVVLYPDELDALVESLEQAIAFASFPSGGQR